MSVPGAFVLVTVALTGLLALVSCVALFIWVAGQYSGQPVTFREAFLSTAKLALILGVLGGLGLAALVFLSGKTP